MHVAALSFYLGFMAILQRPSAISRISFGGIPANIIGIVAPAMTVQRQQYHDRENTRSHQYCQEYVPFRSHRTTIFIYAKL
jgi:hypothetical protein